MDTIGNQTMVVGIDGSANSRAALAWAVDEASRWGLRLHLVCAGAHQPHGDELALNDGYVDAAVANEALEAADARLAEAADSALESAPGLAITMQSSLDRAASTLISCSALAHSVVVGRSGHGAVSSAVLGSVASQVATHAQCPVVIVHAAHDYPTGQSGVAVAVDGSPGSDLALAHAFQQASARGVRLHVIHAWWSQAGGGRMPETQVDRLAQEKLALAEVMAGWSEHYPDVDVRVSVPVGPTVRAITDAARGAEMLVVGNRGRGGFRSLLLGSVSQGVLHHAACTVLVMRPRRAGPIASGALGAPAREGAYAR